MSHDIYYVVCPSKLQCVLDIPWNAMELCQKTWLSYLLQQAPYGCTKHTSARNEEDCITRGECPCCMSWECQSIKWAGPTTGRRWSCVAKYSWGQQNSAIECGSSWLQEKGLKHMWKGIPNLFTLELYPPRQDGFKTKTPPRGGRNWEVI